MYSCCGYKYKIYGYRANVEVTSCCFAVSVTKGCFTAKTRLFCSTGGPGFKQFHVGTESPLKALDSTVDTPSKCGGWDVTADSSDVGLLPPAAHFGVWKP